MTANKPPDDELRVESPIERGQKLLAAAAAALDADPIAATIVTVNSLCCEDVAHVHPNEWTRLLNLLGKVRGLSKPADSVRSELRKMRKALEIRTRRDERDARVSARVSAQGAQDRPDLPEIMLDVKLHENERAALAALAPREIYARAGRLVRPVADDQLHDLVPDALLTVLSESATFLQFRNLPDGSRELSPCSPPLQLAKSLCARGDYPGVRPLIGVTRTPILRTDGTVTTAPGYDRASRLLYRPSGCPELLPAPTLADARAAIARLRKVIAQVPLKTPADRAAWLALVLTLAARPAIDGSVPMFLGTANQARTGKTRMLQYGGLIAHGRMTSTTTYPPEEDELRKKVDAFVFGGGEYVILDNIRGAIGGPALETVLTTAEHQGRVLGSSRIVTGPARTVWAASANGGQLRGDMAGRTLPIRLHWSSAHPERRQFRIPNLTKWVEARRASLLADAITIVRAYLLQPERVELAPWGSFEAWSEIVRGALVWAGQPDPIETREDLDVIDAGASAHERLVTLAGALWPDGLPWTAGQLAGKVDAPGRMADHTIAMDWTLTDARDVLGLLGAWDRAAQRVDVLRLGKLLAELVDRPTADGQRITRQTVDGKVRKSKTGAPYWTVAGVDAGVQP